MVHGQHFSVLRHVIMKMGLDHSERVQITDSTIITPGTQSLTSLPSCNTPTHSDTPPTTHTHTHTPTHTHTHTPTSHTHTHTHTQTHLCTTSAPSAGYFNKLANA